MNLSRIICCGSKGWGIPLLAFLFFVGCGPEDDEPVDNTPEEPSPRTALTESEYFEVTWDGPVSPLPFQQIFEISIDVIDAESGEPAEGLDLQIRAQVADTTATTPTEPQVVDAGGGRYNVAGLLFHIPREWEFIVDIDDGERIDRARFALDAVGLYEGDLPEDPTETFSDDDLRHILTMSPAPPPPADPTNAVADDENAAHLGQFLFFDTRFSADETVSCASCHLPDHGFSDSAQLSLGIGETARHSMPAANAAYQRWNFWDGRTDSLWSQALAPIEDPNEHGSNRCRVAHLIFEEPDLRDAFEANFGPMPDLADEDRFPPDARPVPDDAEHPHNQAWTQMSDEDRLAIDTVFANFGKAIAAYERRLIRNDAPFDRFVKALRDEDSQGLDAITDEARQGLQVFVGDGQCVDCHNGHQLSNFEFHNLGMEPRSWMPDGPDMGRSEGIVTVAQSDFSAHGPHSDDPDSEAAKRLSYLREPDIHTDGTFKTPGLRNVAERAPFMHGAHMGNLGEVVDFYSDLQEDPVVGIRDPLLQQVNLSNDDIDALVAFMESLTGEELPEELKQSPEAPAP